MTDHDGPDAAVRASRADDRQFRQLAESLPQLVWACRPDGPCDYLSPQWIAYTGRSEAEQLGYGWLEALHPDDRARTQATWAEAAARGAPFDIEFRIRRHDGAYRWFKTRAAALTDPAGHVTRWFGSNTDIQDLRTAEEELRQANAELERRIAERAAALTAANARLAQLAQELTQAQAITHTGSWVLDVASGRVTWSEELFRVLGLPAAAEAPPYETHASLFTAESWARLEPAVARSVATGAGYELELECVRPDGERRWAVARAACERDASGAVVRLFGTFQDVTELRQARAERDRAAERMALATRGARIGVWEWEPERDVLHWDEGMFALYGLPPAPGPMRSSTYFEALHPDDLANVQRATELTLGEGRDFDIVFRVRRPDGAVRHLHGVALAYRRGDGTVERMIGVNWDVTAQVVAERALRQRSEELARSNADLEQFAYAASHDLQEPLRSVAGCAQLLQLRYAGKLDASADELVGHVVDGCERMRVLIGDLLAYSRVGTRGGTFSRLQAGDLVRRAIAHLGAAVTESGAAIDVEEPLPTVLGDATQLVQLFQNLLGNAIKYRGTAPPRIRVRAERREEMWEFSVLDNGIGIDPRYAEQVFQLFQRLHSRADYPGTGIGLALCRRIVDRHGGRIWVESRLGEGADFRFRLPVPPGVPA